MLCSVVKVWHAVAGLHGTRSRVREWGVGRPIVYNNPKKSAEFFGPRLGYRGGKRIKRDLPCFAVGLCVSVVS